MAKKKNTKPVQTEEATIQTVTIDGTRYDVSKLTETATALISDIGKVDAELDRLNLSLSITNLAKGALIDKLLAEKENLSDAVIE